MVAEVDDNDDCGRLAASFFSLDVFVIHVVLTGVLMKFGGCISIIFGTSLECYHPDNWIAIVSNFH